MNTLLPANRPVAPITNRRGGYQPGYQPAPQAANVKCAVRVPKIAPGYAWWYTDRSLGSNLGKFGCTQPGKSNFSTPGLKKGEM